MYHYVQANLSLTILFVAFWYVLEGFLVKFLHIPVGIF